MIQSRTVNLDHAHNVVYDHLPTQRRPRTIAAIRVVVLSSGPVDFKYEDCDRPLHFTLSRGQPYSFMADDEGRLLGFPTSGTATVSVTITYSEEPSIVDQVGALNMEPS